MHNYEIIHTYICAIVWILQKIINFANNLELSEEELNKIDFMYYSKIIHIL